MRFSSHGSPDPRSGGKRCALPEIHNPDFESRNPGGNSDLRSLLAPLLLVLMLFLGFQYFRQPKLSVPIPAGQAQPQPAHVEIDKTHSAMADTQPIASPGNFGWLTFIAKPLYQALCFLHEHGIRNWGWSIITLTVIFNLLIVWPRMMSMKSSLKMMRVQPKVDALKKRYAHLKISDPKRAEMNTEMMALYKQENVNMYGGCLPLLIQMPLFFAYYRVLANVIELRQAHWYWLTDLSVADPLHILPILIIASMFLVQFITPSPGMDPNQRRMMAIMM